MKYQTRGVLAGAYKGGTDGRTLLTHLVWLDADGAEFRVSCPVKVAHIADHYAHTPEELTARPTCSTCAAQWDKLQPKKTTP